MMVIKLLNGIAHSAVDGNVSGNENVDNSVLGINACTTNNNARASNAPHIKHERERNGTKKN